MRLKDSQKNLADLKKQLDETERGLFESIERGEEFHSYLKIYEDRAKSDYDILLEQAKAEIENIRREEQEKQKEEISEQQRNERTSIVSSRLRFAIANLMLTNA